MRAEKRSSGRILLQLLGSSEFQRNLRDLTGDQWADILAMAGQHRLLPRLHAMLERGKICIFVPDEIREILRIAHRDSALLALAQRTELFSTVELLRTHGIETVALKGAWLAWYAYPAAAERPLRDIDLLCREDQALAAFDILKSHGFFQSEASALPPEEMTQAAKHLPPLTSPSGVEFEIHMHVWEPEGGAEWPMPSLIDKRILAEAKPGDPCDPCRYPKPYHMLIHLVVHTAYSHRFDVGPLILSDIDHLTKAHSIDWHNFWSDAHDGGFAEGATLVLRLVEQWRNNSQIGWRGCKVGYDNALLADCEALLVQDISVRKDAGMASAIIEARKEGGLAGVIGSLKSRSLGNQRGRFGGQESPGSNYLEWVWRRGSAFVRSMANAEIRETASRHARLGRFLRPEKQAQALPRAANRLD